MNRGRALIGASAVSMLGWGTVLPYQYAYAADTRGWGGLAAAIGSSMFSVGALLAAPLAGRLVDRYSPTMVAVVARIVAALAVLSLVVADRPGLFWLALAVFGFGASAAVPAQSVLVLTWLPAADRRKTFGWLLSAQSLGMGVGALAAGFLVDLSQPDGMVPSFVIAAGGFVVAALTVLVAGRGAPRAAVGSTADRPGDGGWLAALRDLAARPALRWAAVVTITLELAFYAQYESGLPAYALSVLHVSPVAIGLASAVNCAVILALQVVVTRLTARRPAALLLSIVGLGWAGCWALLGAAAFAPGLGSVIFVSSFGLFAIGETMFAPVLNPLIADLAPRGRVGTTLGVFTALQTGFAALGPLLAGVLLSGGTGRAFVGLHIALAVTAALAATRLAPRRSAAAAAAPEQLPGDLTELR